ncbi:hypothetical protein GTS_55340 [Gandjariella thermophila]|uniref:Replication-relaxation n=2 Tax=Gandjariella thermophila TaxID=1931992 RepID=A0A4D4JB64_9PSEU|nr:hypothetical protein GTS_55340 [Gandjariella thermophila]
MPAAGVPDGALWARLTPRDRTVLELVAEHQVLTTEQLRALVFPSISRAQHRLLDLAEAGVLWRTQPYRAEGGSKPFHYLLGYRGAELLAAQQGTSPPRPSAHADRLRRILESPRLGHLLGVNQFFADLAGYSRRAGLGTPFSPADGRPRGEGLHTWRSEKWITEFYQHKITPDGYGCWYQDGRWLGFFLEHDTGTEPLRRVADKLDRYTAGSDDRYSDGWEMARQLAGMVLFWVASRRREQGLRKALQAKHSVVPVATASRDHGDPDGPAGEVWSVVTPDPHRARRVRLGELPAMIGGTIDDGTPTVLHELATRPGPVLDRDDDRDDDSSGEAAFRDGLTDEMREANRHGIDIGDLVLTDPEEDTTTTTTTAHAPRVASTGLTRHRWKRPA